MNKKTVALGAVGLAVVGLGVMATRGKDMPKAGAPVAPLTVKNECSYDIWIQEQGVPGATSVQRLTANGGSLTFIIPAAGLASTRFWAKTGCDENGNNCKMGQSSPPCPPQGCPPPIDSKLEATWGCSLKDPNDCAPNPSAPGKHLDSTTWLNLSGVDGFTLPYTLKILGGDGRQACSNADCSGLNAADCPSDDNLSTDGGFPQYAHANEHVGDGAFIGCFSTCQKLTYPTYGGWGVQPPSLPAAQMYCCPTPPVSSPACQAGPVSHTKYVEMIHKDCKKTVYGYAYDDGVGLRNCSVDTTFTLTYGPNCP